MFFSTEIFRFCFISLAHFDWTDTQHGIAFSILGKKTMNKKKRRNFSSNRPKVILRPVISFYPNRYQIFNPFPIT
jgi:hypothetical protein